MLKRPEQALVSIQLVGKHLIRGTHILHLLIYQPLHIDHICFIFLSNFIEVVVEHLQRLRKRINFIGDLVAKVTNFRDVLEDLVLLVFKMLVQTLNLGDGGLDFDINLGHMLSELLMLRLDPLANLFEHLRLRTTVASATVTAFGHS